ncbi:GxxExxY protein [bacterium]|nr:GxxExxY protein [bacterium]
MKINELTEKIIGLTIKVHRKLGPGLLESVYQAALAYELEKARIPFEREKGLPVQYDNIILDVGFRCDFLVDKRVIVECKSIKQFNEIDLAQALNYLRITKLQVALLINFNVIVLKKGIKRIVNNFIE